MADKSEFDEYAENYNQILQENLGSLGQDLNQIAEYKIKILSDFLRDPPQTILEFGCGIGRNLPYFIKYFPKARLTGCDISAASLEQAGKTFPEVKFFVSENPQQFSQLAGTYDLCFLAQVLHHIPIENRISWLKVIAEKLNPLGRLVIFEHNPYNPVTRRLVSTCVFDVDASLLSRSNCFKLLSKIGLKVIKSGYTLFTPWRKYYFFEKLDLFLSPIPLGGQYYVIAGK
jgi:SAM-dependent methyltransferase